MIHRLSIHGYKSYRQVEINLSGPLFAVMGPNGSGKSNLFDALDLLRRIVLCSTLDMAFREQRGETAEAFSLQAGESGQAFTRDQLQLGFEMDVELSDSTIRATEEEIARRVEEPGTEPATESLKISERFLRYRIQVEYLTRTRVLRVVDEELAALRRDGLPKESRTSFLSRVDDGGKRVIRLRLEGRGGHPAEYDVGLPYAVVSLPHHPPHYPHIDAFKRELAGWQILHLDPHAMRVDAEARATTVLGSRGENLAAFLGTLKEQASDRFQDLCLMLRLLLPRIDGLRVDRSDRGIYRLFVTERGIELSASSLSEGTLLLIGLLAAVQPHPDFTLVALAEPENGLHPFRIGTMARLLQTAAENGPTQLLVNTHSPLLARCLPEKSLFVCRMGPTGTSVEPFRSTGEVMKSVEIQETLNPGDEPDLPSHLMVPFLRGSDND